MISIRLKSKFYSVITGLYSGSLGGDTSGRFIKTNHVELAVQSLQAAEKQAENVRRITMKITSIVSGTASRV